MQWYNIAIAELLYLTVMLRVGENDQIMTSSASVWLYSALGWLSEDGAIDLLVQSNACSEGGDGGDATEGGANRSTLLEALKGGRADIV